MARTKNVEAKNRTSGGKRPRGLVGSEAEPVTKAKVKKVALAKPLEMVKEKEPRQLSRKVKMMRNIRREIRKAQCCEKNLVPKRPFDRLIREVAAEFHTDGLRWKKSAITSLQDEAEAFVSDLMGNADLLTQHRERMTLDPRDLFLAAKMTIPSNQAFAAAIDVAKYEQLRKQRREKRRSQLGPFGVSMHQVKMAQKALKQQKRESQVDTFLASQEVSSPEVEDDAAAEELVVPSVIMDPIPSDNVVVEPMQS
jgi:histone H3